MWKRELSPTRPPKLDFNSSSKYIIERRNIKEISVTHDGKENIEYECEMRFVRIGQFLSNITKLEEENANMLFSLTEKELQIDALEQTQADLLFELIEKGVL